MRRRVMSERQLNEALAPQSLRFVAVERIPYGDGRFIEQGADLTKDVTEGTMPEGALRTHVKRSVVVAFDTGNRAGLDLLGRLKPSEMNRDRLLQSFEAAGVRVATGATTERLGLIRRLVLQAAKAAGKAA